MIIAINDISLGPALGGFRIYNYRSIDRAIEDVLNLSYGMTLKASISGLNLGGGKAVMIGDPIKIKTKEILEAFGKFVDSLNGEYITAPDVNTDINDMSIISNTTKNVVSLPSSMGGSDDPSKYTALGVYYGIKAAAKFIFNSDSLANKNILVEGAGKVGSILIDLIYKENPNIYLLELNTQTKNKIAKKYKINIIEPHDIHKYKFDIYSPNAMGGTINSKLFSKLKAKIIAGGANNQLENTNYSKFCLDNKIIYVPDFVINAGGLINASAEYYKNFNPKTVKNQCQGIYYKVLEILKISNLKNIDTHSIATDMAIKRIEEKVIKPK